MTKSAPALCAAIISVGVMAPGIETSPYFSVRLITSKFVSGEMIYFAPASAAISTSSGVVTVPAPTSIRPSNSSAISDGFNCVYFNGANVKNIRFRDMQCASGMDSVFGGHGTGSVICDDIRHDEIDNFSNVKGIEILKMK